MKIINLKYYTALLLLALIAVSCQKVIKLDLGNQTGQMVIEANFTDQVSTQVVKLSRNVPFTSTNTYPPVTGATVTMDNHHGRIITFNETSPGSYSVDSIGGIYGRSYTMSVVSGGTTYTANSTMSNLVALDSIASLNNIFDNKTNTRMISVYFQDPSGVPNYYRFILWVNNVQVKDVFAFDDQFFDGKYVNFNLQQNDIDIHPGDTVKVEMQCIDKPVYTYWFTLSQQQANNPGGQIAPSNPPTNFTPIVLGYFSAHTTQTIKLVTR
jgi:hypothetical protein